MRPSRTGVLEISPPVYHIPIFAPIAETTINDVVLAKLEVLALETDKSHGELILFVPICSGKSWRERSSPWKLDQEPADQLLLILVSKRCDPESNWAFRIATWTP